MGLSLRLRFFLALGVVVALLTGTFAVGSLQSIEVLELELLHGTLARELQQFADSYARDPGVPPPRGAELTGYVVRPGDSGDLPSAFEMLPPGMHDDVLIDDREYMVGRADVDGARLYLALDIERIEKLEQEITSLALLSIVVGLVLAALGAAALGRAVMQPVTRLSQMVGALAPGQRGVRLVERFGDREVGLIAAALDRYLRRLDGYIERERAFTEDASHELRTPVATVLSAAQLVLGDTALPASTRERLLRIERAAREMQSLIDALLVLAREDTAPADPDCPLDELLREAAAALAEVAATHGVTLVLDATPLRRPAMPGMARSIFNNLLLNAIQHGGTGTVRAVLNADGLRVEDRGPGLPPGEADQLFERGARGPESHGQGIGLHLVRRMCDRLGWSVEAHRGNDGAVFAITFGHANEKLTHR